jgi:hypothetical protein
MMIAQFDDGGGWRGNRTVPDGLTMEAAINFVKEHWGSFNEGGRGRWLKDYIRLVETTDEKTYKIIWLQEGALAEPKEF